MSEQNDIKSLIKAYRRRLQKLKEQQAVQGISVDPKIPIEIEDIEAAIEKLQKELANIESKPQTQKQKQSSEVDSDEVVFLKRIFTGKELVAVLRNAHFFSFDNDELETQMEVELVSDFLQNLHNLGDFLGEYEAGEIVRIEFSLNSEIKELEENGFFVFADRKVSKMNVGGMIDNWATAIVHLRRSTNPSIISISDVAKALDDVSPNDNG